MARSLYVHMAQNESHAHVFSHPLALTALLEGFATLARAAAERRDAEKLGEYGQAASQLFFTACPPVGELRPEDPSMEVTGPLCAAALAVFCEAGMVGETRLVLAHMAAAELEPTGSEFASLQRLVARGSGVDALAFAMMMAQLDPQGTHRMLLHTRGGAAYVALLALLSPECPRAAVEQLLDCARADDPPQAEALLEALLAVVAALPSQAERTHGAAERTHGAASARPPSSSTFKDPAAALALVRECLRHILHGGAFRAVCFMYECVAQPTPARGAEGRVSRLVHEAVDACALAAVVARGVALEAGLDPSLAAQLGAALAGGAAVEPGYETRVLRRAAHCVELALLAYGALIGHADSVDTAEALLAEAADFQRANAQLVRLARALAGTAAEADAPQVGTAPALRRLRVAAAVEPFQAPLAGLLRFAASAPPGRSVRVAAVVSGLAQPAPLEAPRARLAGAAMNRAVPCGAGAATARAWAEVLEAEAVAPAPSAALVALRLALQDGEVSPALETALVPALRRAFDAGVGDASPFGPLLPAATLGSGGGASALSAALLLSDEALPLRLAGAAGLRAGCLVVSLWQAYLADKGVLAMGATAAPYSREPTRSAQSAYLAALAAVAACGGAADSTDMCRAPLEDVPAAVVPRVALCPYLALEQARATVCAMAEAGEGPGLADAAALARLCVSVGLVPDARLMLRLTMAPLLGRDYSAAALEEDAARDSRQLRLLQVGSGGAASAPSAVPPWSAWPGQEEVLALSVSTAGRAGLAFGASVPPPHTPLNAFVDAEARARGNHPLPLDTAAFCELALSIGAAGLADELLIPLIEAMAELQAAFTTPAPPLLDSTATLAAYCAFAMCGDLERAEAVLRDPRFCAAELVKPYALAQARNCAAVDDVAARILERPVSLRAAFNMSGVLAHRSLLGTSPFTYAALVNTFRAVALASGGHVHRALRLLEVAVAHPAPSGRPLLLPAAFVAVLAACLRLNDAELTAELPADSARATLLNPYADARKLLGEEPTAMEVGSGVFVGGEAAGSAFATLAPLVHNPGSQMVPLLTQLELIGSALRTTGVWAASPADIPLLVRLYGAAKRTDEAAALGWAGVACALEAVRRVALRDVELGGLGTHPSPARGGPDDARGTAVDRLRTVELLLLDALQLCHAPLPPLRGGVAPLRAGSFGTAEERPAPPSADTVAQCRALGESWGLPFPETGSVEHPEPADLMQGAAAVPASAALLGSLLDALALLYATAPPSAYSARRVVEHCARTLLDAAAATHAPLSGASMHLLDLVVARCRASGSYAPHNSAAAEAVAAVCDFPPPPHALLMPTATATLLMRVPVAASPAVVVWGRNGGGARRALPGAVAPPPSPLPAMALAPNVLLSVLAFAGALTPAVGPPRASPCAPAAQLHSALAWRAGAPKRVTTHSAAAVAGLLAETVRAFGGEPPPRVAATPPRALDLAAQQQQLAAAVASHHLAQPAQPPSSPQRAFSDPALRSLENEVFSLEQELAGLKANTGACEDLLLRLKQQAPLDPEGGGGAGALGACAGPLRPLPLEAAAREAELRKLLANLSSLEETLRDALALQPELRADLAAWMEYATRVEAGTTDARRALQTTAAGISALEARYHEMVAVFEASLEASRSPRYTAAGRAAAAERAAELQTRVLGPAVASVVAAQTARLRAEGALQARTRAAAAEALHDAQRWAFETAQLALGERIAAERGVIEAAERRLEAVRALAADAAASEAAARLELRALRARVDAAQVELARAPREAAELVLGKRAEEAALAARKEAEKRALAADRAEVAAAEARSEGERALAAVREDASRRMEAVQVEFRERSESAKRAIRTELDAKLAPVMAAARAAAARAEERLTQLRRELGVMEGDLHATLGSSAHLLGVGGEPAGSTELGAQLCAAVEQVSEMGTSREAAALTLAVLDDVLPVALAAQGNSVRANMVLQMLEESIRHWEGT
jgi:hypothetical protein